MNEQATKKLKEQQNELDNKIASHSLLATKPLESAKVLSDLIYLRQSTQATIVSKNTLFFCF